MQTQEILEISPTSEKIYKLLRNHRLPIHKWGTKNYRSFDDLVQSMKRDRVTIRNHGTPELILDVHALVILVLYKYRNRCMELYEVRQVSPHGKVLRRKFNGIAETMKQNESDLVAARRCLREELGFSDPKLYSLSERLKIEHLEPQPSEKWPGIKSSYHRHIFQCEISQELFKKKGYVEIDNGWTIFFKWKPSAQMIFGI
jgi:hypothetical protein